MLNEEQIKEAAKKRLQNMNYSDRKKIEDQLNERYDIIDKVRKEGYDSLNRDQKSKFSYYETQDERKSNADGISGNDIEYVVMKKFNISRDEIKTMKKNPYKAGMYKQILLTVLANVGMGITAVISNSSGMDLSFAYPILSAVSGIFALSFGKELVDCIKFRNLQKKYDDPSFQDKEIDAEVYKMIRDEVKKSRGR